MADFGTVARPYARAVFEVARAAGDLEAWSHALAAGAAIASDRTAHEYLSQPGLSDDQRTEFVASTAAELPGGAVLGTGEGRNLLRLLSENDRLDALEEISSQFDQLKAEQENKVRVTLVAAAGVDAETTDKITLALGKRLGRKVELALEIDPALIGGAVIRAEDMVIDDSLRARLTRLAGALVD
jgi:F-type H+-transporting ATPase subunit delta